MSDDVRIEMHWVSSAIYREAPDIRTPSVRRGYGRKSGSSAGIVQAGSIAALQLTCSCLLPFGTNLRGFILFEEALAEPFELVATSS